MGQQMTENEANELWINIRELIVKENIITSNGIGTSDSNDKLQKELRKLILIKSQQK